MSLFLNQKKLLMVDLDGTIRKTISGEEFINDPSDQQIISEASEALIFYKQAGLKILGITNQGGVHYGYKTLQTAHVEQMITLINCQQLDAIFWCPDMGDTCYQTYSHGELMNISHIKYELQDVIKSSTISDKYNFRKPSPGMLRLAMNSDKTYFAQECLYTGDMDSDRQAAKALNIDFLELNDFYDYKNMWSI